MFFSALSAQALPSILHNRLGRESCNWKTCTCPPDILGWAVPTQHVPLIACIVGQRWWTLQHPFSFFKMLRDNVCHRLIASNDAILVRYIPDLYGVQN